MDDPSLHSVLNTILYPFRSSVVTDGIQLTAVERMLSRQVGSTVRCQRLHRRRE